MQLRLFCVITVCVVLGFAGFLAAQDFRQYPGSKFDEKASEQASAVAKGMECHVYTTDDSLDKVHAFYKALYKEFVPPFPRQKLPNGQEVRWAFFIIDSGKDLADSKYWMKVQRPYIGTVDNGADFKDIREVSVIQTIRRR